MKVIEKKLDFTSKQVYITILRTGDLEAILATYLQAFNVSYCVEGFFYA